MRPKISHPLLLMHLLTLFLGISFTTIPSAAGFLMSEKGMHLSKLDYGNLFIVLISGALFTSYFSGNVIKKTGIKSVLLFGTTMAAGSMALFSLEALFLHQKTVSYSLLMWVMFFLGCGFGALITSLSTFAFRSFSSKKETPLTALYIVLGMGCAIGPLLFTLFLFLDKWWMDPLITSASFMTLGIFSKIFFPKAIDAEPIASFSMTRVPKNKLFWIFALMALIYGLCETLIGTWSTVFLPQDKAISIPLANYALSLFWMSITAGRILISVFRSKINTKILFLFNSLLMAIGFILVARSISHSAILLAFFLIGLGCSGTLPLILSVSQKLLPKAAIILAGSISGLYIIGYGLASSGMASLERRSGLTLSSLFVMGSVFALVLFVLALFAIKRGRAF